jgi:hypothetical protein
MTLSGVYYYYSHLQMSKSGYLKFPYLKREDSVFLEAPVPSVVLSIW